MADTFNLKIIVPGGIILDDSGISSLFAVGEEGGLEVLPGHTEFLTPLRVSRMEVFKPGRYRQLSVQWSVAGGILQVSKEGVAVISPAVERADNIDVERARNARGRARDRLAKAKSGIDMERARQAEERAEVRLKVATFKQDNSDE